jgi:peptidoglycan/LPS O-acetylase OafA/YrhL
LVYLALVGLFLRFVRGKPMPSIPGLSFGIAQVGLLSFSWYLIHENVGISMLTTLDLYMPAHVALVVTVVATFVLAIGFAALFEWRFRKPVERWAMAVLDWIGRRISWLAPLRSAPMAQTAAE